MWKTKYDLYEYLAILTKTKSPNYIRFYRDDWMLKCEIVSIKTGKVKQLHIIVPSDYETWLRSYTNTGWQLRDLSVDWIVGGKKIYLSKHDSKDSAD